MTTFADPPAPVMPDAQQVTAELRRDIEEWVEGPDIWLNTPHAMLGGQKPGDLLGSPNEHSLWTIIQMIKYGMFT